MDASTANQTQRTTGPLGRAYNKVIRLFPQRPSDPQVVAPGGNIYDRLLAEVETFSEDHLTIDDKALTFLSRLFAVLAPFAAVLAVGDTIGAFLAPAFGAFPAFVLSYLAEAGKAFLVFTMSRALAKRADGASYWVRLAFTVCIWIILQTGTTLVLYHIAVTAIGTDQYTMWRVATFASIDLISVCILFWRGKSLAQHLSTVNTKISAFNQVHSAERAEEQAKQQAAIRDQQAQITMEAQQKFANALVGMMDDFLAQVQQQRNGNRNRISNY